MSKGTPYNKQFVNECKSAASRVLSAWCNDVNVYWHGDLLYARKDYELIAQHSWGTIQCYWDKEDKEELYKKLREVGATNISGTFRWNYIDLRFDIKKGRLKKDGLA